MRDCWRCAGWGWIIPTDDDHDDDTDDVEAVMRRWHAHPPEPAPVPTYADDRMYSPTMRYLGAMQSWTRRAARWS